MINTHHGLHDFPLDPLFLPLLEDFTLLNLLPPQVLIPLDLLLPLVQRQQLSLGFLLVGRDRLCVLLHELCYPRFRLFEIDVVKQVERCHRRQRYSLVSEPL